MNVGVLLAGSGVYDGSEIHEATLSLLAIKQNDGNYVCYAPNKDQLHVFDHLTGDVVENESRNVLVESARIARGNVSDVSKANVDLLDALLIPGGFGAAKNLNTWAVSGPDSEIDPDVRRLIIDMLAAGKPIVALCMGPTVVAKAVEGMGMSIKMTMGTTEEPSPYDIAEIIEGIEKVGAKHEKANLEQIVFDEDNKVITAPCYMMEADIDEIYNNVKKAVDKLFEIA